MRSALNEREAWRDSTLFFGFFGRKTKARRKPGMVDSLNGF
jgi:hypothetical protein